MCPQSIFEQKYENSPNMSTENHHFNSREKSLYVAWACFRNAKRHMISINLEKTCYASVFMLLLFFLL